MADSMIDLNTIRTNTAGAYIALDGLYPFAIGAKLHNGSIPVIRLGGHVEADETAWECAQREVLEEAAVTIQPLPVRKTYLVRAGGENLALEEIPWERDSPQPILVVAYGVDRTSGVNHFPDTSLVGIAERPLLSVMFLARTEALPRPSGEVQGILLLDAERIRQICAETVTLDQYRQGGGKALLQGKFDGSRPLEPFIQLRIFAEMLQAGLV